MSGVGKFYCPNPPLVAKSNSLSMDIFIYNHNRGNWNRIASEYDHFTMDDVRSMLSGNIIERPSGARYCISAYTPEEFVITEEQRVAAIKRKVP
jgi:hypothetical protein